MTNPYRTPWEKPPPVCVLRNLEIHTRVLDICPRCNRGGCWTCNGRRAVHTVEHTRSPTWLTMYIEPCEFHGGKHHLFQHCLWCNHSWIVEDSWSG